MTTDAGATAAPTQSRGAKVRRASWNLADQALSAATNVLLSFLVARNVSADEFGAFAVAFLLFSLMIGVSRALVGSPLSIRHSAEVGRQRRRTAKDAFGTVLTITLLVSLVLGIVGLVFRQTLGSTLLALAIVLPFLILQDTCRMAFFAWARPQLATLNDAIWAVLQFSFVIVLVELHHVSAPALVLAWGLAAAPAALIGMLQLHAAPAFGRVAVWIREKRDIVGYLLAEYLVGVGTFQGGLLLIGGLLGLSDIGSLRAAQILLGPLGIVATATVTFGVPEIARHGRLPRHTLRLATFLSIALVSVSVLYVLVLLLIPSQVGVQLLGDTWEGARSVLVPVAAGSIFAAGKLGPTIFLYGRGLMRATFRLAVTLAVSAIVFMCVGAWVSGVVGLAWGIALAQALVAPLWYRKLRIVVHEGEAVHRGPRPRVVLLDLLSWSSFATWGPALRQRGVRVLRVSPAKPWPIDLPLRVRDRLALGAWPRRVRSAETRVVTPELMKSLLEAPTIDLHASEEYLAVAMRLVNIPLGTPLGRVPDQARQQLLYDKLTMTQYAASLGCQVPQTWALAPAGRYPIVAKGRAGAGGQSVRIARDDQELADAVEYLDPYGQEAAFFQELVEGDVINAGGVSREGRILVSAIYSATPPEHDPFGPAEVVQILDLPDLQRDLEVLLEALEYSGVFCLDYLVRADGSHALLDFNSRAFGGWLPLQVAGLDMVGAYLSLFDLDREPRVRALQPGITLRDCLVPSSRAEDLASLRRDWRRTRSYLRQMRPYTGRMFTATYQVRGAVAVARTTLSLAGGRRRGAAQQQD